MEDKTDIIDVAKLIGKRKVGVVSIPEKGDIAVQSLTFGELADVYSAAKDDMLKQTLGLIIRGVTNPKLSYEQAKQLAPSEIRLIVTKITELSGFSKEEMEEGKKWLGPQRGI